MSAGARWQREFPAEPPLKVSVNLSPRQFDDPNLVTDVAAALAGAHIGAALLKLEITEGLIMRDTEKSIETLQKLKDFGVTIAIDDFGTGYSSLSYLRKLPLDVLKIDRSFVQGIGRSTEDDAIVQAVISVAQSLGLSVTAEGIETNEQAALLRQWSCQAGQGYLFSRPLPPEELTAMFRARSSIPMVATRRRSARSECSDGCAGRKARHPVRLTRVSGCMAGSCVVRSVASLSLAAPPLPVLF